MGDLMSRFWWACSARAWNEKVIGHIEKVDHGRAAVARKLGKRLKREAARSTRCRSVTAVNWDRLRITETLGLQLQHNTLPPDMPRRDYSVPTELRTENYIHWLNSLMD